VIETEKLSKEYRTGPRRLTVLDGVDLRIGSGEFVSVVGPSGSGKSTLLALLAGLDDPTSGRVVIDGQDLAGLDEDGRARLRRDRIGFVFQSFQLIPSLTALENVRVPLDLAGRRDGGERARALLARVGLADRLDHLPVQLSGGEQQRVALARAFVHDPDILFADEPTGNLDRAAGAAILGLVRELNREHRATVVLVTHDVELASAAERTIRLRDGRLLADGDADAPGSFPADDTAAP
jgi:putative ABC transport system ATP-binding protein